jgi:Pyruvate/2-oxoacid:ferredoxin oxidoreductase gamma subunit
MPDGLTAKQTTFVEALLSGMNQADAYRAAYDCSKMSENALYREASLLTRHPKVAQRLAEAAQASREKMEISTARLTEMALEAYEVAKGNGNASHMTGAVLAIGKLNGLIIDRQERKVETIGPKQSRDEMIAEMNKLAAEMGMAVVDIAPKARH